LGPIISAVQLIFSVDFAGAAGPDAGGRGAALAEVVADGVLEVDAAGAVLVSMAEQPFAAEHPCFAGAPLGSPVAPGSVKCASPLLASPGATPLSQPTPARMPAMAALAIAHDWFFECITDHGREERRRDQFGAKDGQGHDEHRERRRVEVSMPP
jgi:hypothetical protein